jgi:hypothetical protein
MFFVGNIEVINGSLRPDLAWPDLGLEFKTRDAQRFAA